MAALSLFDEFIISDCVARRMAYSDETSRFLSETKKAALYNRSRGNLKIYICFLSVLRVIKNYKTVHHYYKNKIVEAMIELIKKFK